MIIDCHTHIKSSSDKSDVADHLDANENVDFSIVLAGSDLASDESNRQLFEHTANSRKLLGFAVVNPLTDKIGIKDITALSKTKDLKGLVVYCCQAQFHPAHTRAMRLYEAAEKLSLPVFFHNGPPYQGSSVMGYAQPHLLDEIASTFPSLKIVVGGMGRPFLEQTFCLLAKHENVYSDLTICPDKKWQVYVAVIGAYEASVMDKLLFGSGYPFAEPGNCIETLLGFNKLLADTSLPSVPREEIRSVIERDALAILGIENVGA